MNDTIEQRVRAGLLELAESRSTDAEARLRAINFHPQTARRVRWQLAGLAGALLAAGATAGVFLSSTAPEAFAGWTAVPAAPTPSALRAATVACNALNPTSGELKGTPVLAEQRGRYTAALYVNQAKGWNNVCISDGFLNGAGVSGGQAILKFSSAPGADQLGMPQDQTEWALGFPGAAARYRGQPAWWTTLKGARPRYRGLTHSSRLGWAQYLVGLAGRNVQAVEFLFDRGVTVNATVEHGWYFAWWPGLALPNSVQVTTRKGSATSSPIPGTPRWNRACPQRRDLQHLSSSSSCGVFATGERPSAIREEQAWLKSHPHPGR